MSTLHKTGLIRMLAVSLCLVPAALHLQAQDKPGAPALTAKQRRDIFDSTLQAFNRYYVFPDRAAEVSARLRRNYRPEDSTRLSKPADLAVSMLKAFRRELSDRHFEIRYDPQLAARITSFNNNPQPFTADRERERQSNFFFRKLEILPGNIGYLEFTNFADTSVAARKTVRAAIEFVANSDALIIDLRNNFGGNGIMSGEIAGYFFSDRLETGRSFNRISNQWTSQQVINNPSVTGGLVMPMPLYILTSHRTYSAAEGLAYTLQQHRGAVVVGDSTRGGAHLTRSFSIGNGFVAFIPYMRSEDRVTGTDWEGTGVIPSMPAPEKQAAAYAQLDFLRKKSDTLTGERERAKTNWLVNQLESVIRPLSPDSSQLLKYCGQFEEFRFELSGGNLYCRNLHRPGYNRVMTAISNTLFAVDEEMQVEFLLNPSGIISEAKLYWNDGAVDLIKKNTPAL